MSIIGAFILPHPPIIVPAVGNGEEVKLKKTQEAYETVSRQIATMKPETIVIISPHSIMYSDYFHISPGDSASGNLSKFHAPSAASQADYDTALVAEITACAESMGIPAGILGERDASLDHGTLIPLLFLKKALAVKKIVRIGPSGLSLGDQYKFGQCIAIAADRAEKDVVLIASGDLSHKLADDGPYGFAAEGVQFDKEVTAAMARGDFLKFLSFDGEFLEKAAECGLKSFAILAGTLDGHTVTAKLHSYEGPFGVGYAVASFIPGAHDESRRFLAAHHEKEAARIAAIKAAESPYVRLARYAAEHFIRSGQCVKLSSLSLPKEMTSKKAGVFVSIKKQGNLRGCIGTIAPATNSIAEEIIRNAANAATEDSRFDPISEQELGQLSYSVDVLGAPEPISDISELNPEVYGVIVTSGRKRGLLLPNLAGVDSSEQQVEIALQKAGIQSGESYNMERFQVVRYK